MKRAIVLLGPCLLLAVWAGISSFGLVKAIFLPSPVAVFREICALFASGQVWVDFMPTVLRWLAGVLLGILFGIPVGILLGYSKKSYEATEVLLDFFRSIPVMTLFPLFLVMFGLGDKSKVAVATWASFLFVVINTIYGVRHVRVGRRMLGTVLRISRYQAFVKILLPSALPEIVVGIRNAVSMALVVVVASEMILGTKHGLGRRIIDASMVYETETMFAYILIAGVLGYLANKTFVLLDHKFIHWAER